MEASTLPGSISYTDVINSLFQKSSKCHDHHCTAYQLVRHDSGDNILQFGFKPLSEKERLSMPENVDLSSHAETMLLTRLRIPGGYFHRCPVNLQEEQINYWLLNSRQNLYLRFHGQSHIRAIFGPRFKPDLDDHRVIPVFVDAMEKHAGPENGDLVLSSFGTDEKITYLTTLLTNLEAEHENVRSKAGVALINSEVGCSALHIRPIVFNWRYHRWLDFYAGSEGCTSLRHTRQLPDGIMDVAVQKAIDAAQRGVQRLYETMHEEVQNPARDLKKLIDDSAVLSARVMDSLIEDYEIKQLTVKYQIAEDILLACKDLPLFKQHVVKVEVGRYLNLFGADDARMDAIFDD